MSRTPDKKKLSTLLDVKLSPSFRLTRLYYLQLKHGLMGFFPAINTKTKDMVFAERATIEKVWKMLSPRKSSVGVCLALVNDETGEACILSGIESNALFEEQIAKAEIEPFLTEAKFAELSKLEEPFMWAPGLVGNDMSLREFQQTVAAAMEKLHQAA